jgi:DNA-directed RNA polymerase specialized sigma subunit
MQGRTVAWLLGISGARVSQIEAEARRKLRAELGKAAA